jgi:SAM-dependent methyltransferase
VQKPELHLDREAAVKRYYRHVERYDWTHAADTFVGLEAVVHRRRCDETVRLVRRNAGGCARFVDVGCGTALITRHLGPGAVGVDLNPRNLDKARRYAPTSFFVLGDAEGAIPLRDASFDVAICTEMLEHLLHPGRALAEIQRILRPGGWLIGSVPGRSLLWKLRWLSASRASFTEEPYHKHYRSDELRSLLGAYFAVEQLYSTTLRVNWFFVARRRTRAPVARR